MTAVIYTHSHVDHYAGIGGVLDPASVAAGDVRIIAPAGFLEAVVSENIVAGNVMRRRGSYMYGALLPPGPRGHIDSGLGKGVPLLPTQSLVAPTEEVADTRTELTVDNAAARQLQANALEQLGYQADSGPWRDFYLTGAQELRHGHPHGGRVTVDDDTVAAMTTEMVFDYLGVRIDGLAAAARTWSIDVTVRDRAERWRVGIERGALNARRHPPTEGSTDDTPLRIEATHAGLAALVFGPHPLDRLEDEGTITVSGDRDALTELLGVLDTFTLMFPIVTPR